MWRVPHATTLPPFSPPPGVVCVKTALGGSSIHSEKPIPVFRINNLRMLYYENLVNYVHVVTRCFGGTKADNIVIVPIAHHFVQHQHFGLNELVMFIAPFDVLNHYYVYDIVLVWK